MKNMDEKWFNKLKLILSNQPTPLYFAPRPGLDDPINESWMKDLFEGDEYPGLNEATQELYNDGKTPMEAAEEIFDTFLQL